MNFSEIEEVEIPTSKIQTKIEEDPFPKLSQLCVKNIVENIKSYESFEGVRDSFILELIINELKVQKKLNNSTLKLFLFEDLEILDLGPEIAATDGTLTRIGKKCTGLTQLRLKDCLALTDTRLQFLLKKCTKLKMIFLERCKHITDHSLLSIAQITGPKLRCLSLKYLPQITDKGVKIILERCTGLNSLMIIGCMSLSDELKEWISRKKIQKFVFERFLESDIEETK